MKPVSVLVPTLRRPQSLERTLASVFAQAGAADLIAEVVVADNSPEASARPLVEALAAEAPVPVRYVHEPEPGVANVRNAGLRACSAPLIAFIDDDEEASPGWLKALLEAHRGFDGDVTFGPVRGFAPDAKDWERDYVERFFSRVRPDQSGPIQESYGCGNSLMTRESVLAGPQPFDPAANHSGGEDDRLFARLRSEGRRFVWAADAWVTEHAPPERAHMGYVLARAFGFGQSPGQACARADPPDRLGMAKWFCVGLVQTAVFGAAALGLWALRSSGRFEMADRAARGLGKVFWFAKAHFYGAAAVKGPAAPSSTRVSLPEPVSSGPTTTS